MLTLSGAQATSLSSRYLEFRNPIELQACFANATDALRRNSVNVLRQTSDAVLGSDGVGAYQVLCLAQKGVVFVAVAANDPNSATSEKLQKIADTLATYRW